MVQIKVFDESHEDDLTEAVNNFLLENEDYEFVDIHFSNAISIGIDEQIYCFSALLVYLDKSVSQGV